MKGFSIALVNPPSSRLTSDLVFPPLGILYLYSALEKNGFKVRYYDCAGWAAFPDIQENIIGITMTTPQAGWAEEFARGHKAKGKLTIAGGCGTVSIKDKASFDFISRGEQEFTLPAFFNALPWWGLAGGDIKVWERQLANPTLPDIDKIPFPKRELIYDAYDYRIEGAKAATMITSRGCPFQCSFCVDGRIATTRVRSIENVNQEIDSIYGLGYRAVMFFDDIFTYSRERVGGIGGHLKSKGMPYRCFTHVKYAKKIASTLKNTGCVEVGIGIESGDDGILQKIKKGFTVSQAIESIKALKAEGLRVKAFLMIGLPGETEESANKIREFLDKVKPDDFDVSIYMPYPSTEIWDSPKEFGINFDKGQRGYYKADPSRYSQSVSTDSLSASRILELRNSIEKEFKA